MPDPYGVVLRAILASCGMLAACGGAEPSGNRSPLHPILSDLQLVERKRDGAAIEVGVWRHPRSGCVLRIEQRLDAQGKTTGVPDTSAADRLLIQTRPGTTRQQVAELAAALGGRVCRHLPRLDRWLIRLEASGADAVSNALASAQTRSFVLRAERDGVLFGEYIPNDPLFSQQNSMRMIMAHKVWGVTTGSSSIAVGVVDSGIRRDHPDLATNIWRNTGEIADGLDNDGNGYTDDLFGWDWVADDNDPSDELGHGTHVAGTLGAIGNNGQTVAGVAWTVRMAPLRVLNAYNFGWYSDWAEAMTYAVDKGITLLQMSLGGTSDSQVLRDAVAYVAARGGLMVICAGNDGANTAWYPARIESPAIISVAASSNHGDRASWSNWHAIDVDIAAPGLDILSTSHYGGSTWMSGTSMATPHVTGACVLMKSVRPGWNWQQVRDAILNGATRLPAWDGVVSSGGVLNLRQSMNLAGYSLANSPTTLQSTGVLVVDEDAVGSMTVQTLDADGDVQFWQITSPPTHGTAGIYRSSSLGDYAVLNYRPAANRSGPDSLTIAVSDNDGSTSTRIISVSVNPVNDPPVCSTAPSLSGSGTVGEVLLGSNGVWHDTADTQWGAATTITYTYRWWRAVDSTGSGALPLADETNPSHTVSTEDAGSWLRLEVIATDDGTGTPSNASSSACTDWTPIRGASNSAPVIITTDPLHLAVDEDALLPISHPLSACDVDGDPLTWTIDSQGTLGAARITGNQFEYLPTPDSYGSDTIVVKVDDGQGGTALLTVMMEVAPLPDAPRILIPFADMHVMAGKPYSHTIPAAAAYDADGDALLWEASGLPHWLSFDASTATFSGTPGTSDVGRATITLTVADPSLLTASATFDLIVDPLGFDPNDMGASGGGDGSGGGCGIGGLASILAVLLLIGIRRSSPLSSSRARGPAPAPRRRCRRGCRG